MGTKTLTMPEDILIDVFWRTVVESDVTALTKEEKELISKGKLEHKKGETIKWQDLR